MVKDRAYAWQVLKQHVHSEVLLRHCLALEVAMRAYGEKFGQDPEYWGAVGLLHDVDFDKFPDDHPNHARDLLNQAGYSSQFITDVESHARHWEGERTLLQKTMLALDELTGFIIACALVRPDRNLQNLEAKSVIKKLKDKAFARAVNRDTLTAGAADMGVDMKEHIEFVTRALAAAVDKPEYQEVPLL